jgi:mRNA interferase MazF
MKQGDIVLIEFPFTNLAGSKRRPALIISNQDFNKSKNVMLLAISTKPGEEFFSVTLRQEDFINGELKKLSFVRLQNLITLEKQLIRETVARLRSSKLQQIVKKLTAFLYDDE